MPQNLSLIATVIFCLMSSLASASDPESFTSNFETIGTKCEGAAGEYTDGSFYFSWVSLKPIRQSTEEILQKQELNFFSKLMSAKYRRGLQIRVFDDLPILTNPKIHFAVTANSNTEVKPSKQFAFEATMLVSYKNCFVRLRATSLRTDLNARNHFATLIKTFEPKLNTR